MTIRNRKVHTGSNITSYKTPTYVAKKSTPITKVITSSPRPAYPRPISGGCCGKKIPKR